MRVHTYTLQHALGFDSPWESKSEAYIVNISGLGGWFEL